MLAWLLANHWMVLATTAAAAGLVSVAAATGKLPTRVAATLTCAAVVLLLVAGRWPTVLIAGELNPDESLMLAQALKFMADPVPWRSIDPGTGGPINSYALLPLHWLGVPFGYALARWTAIACLAVYLCALYLAMLRIGGARIATAAILPAAVLHSVATDYNATHYSSELASLMTTGILAWAASRLATPGLGARTEFMRAALTGACAFLVTMSKLQGVPLAAVVALAFVALTAPDAAAFARRIGGVLAGGATCLALFLSLMAVTGTLADFRISFLELPFRYSESPLPWSRVKTLPATLPEMRTYMTLMAWAIGATLLVSPLWLRHESPGRIALRVLAVVALLFALFLTLSRPGRFFPHYLAYASVAFTVGWFVLLPWARADTGDVAGRERA